MDRKQQIIQAAFTLFADRGYSLSMSDLAAAVQIKTPSLYSHFQGKDEIIESVIQLEMDRFYASYGAIIEAVQAQPPEEQFKTIFLSIIDYHAQPGHLQFWRNLLLIPQDDLREKCKAMMLAREQSLNQRIETFFRNGVARGELRATDLKGAILLYFTMTQGVLDIMMLEQPGSDRFRQTALLVFNAYWHGVRQTGLEQDRC